MRIAALYDIHGNIDALEAVLADPAFVRVEQVVVGGDVMPGPFPVATLDRLMGLPMPVRFLHGNGDRVVLRHLAGLDLNEVGETYRPSVVWNAEQLSSAQREFVASWPSNLTLEIDGVGRVLFCHATPRNDTEIFTADTPDSALEPVFAGVEADLVVCGHTHMQFDRTVRGLRIVNSGSVGQPHGKPGAHWLLFDGSVAFRTTEYDRGAAAARIRASGSPVAELVAETILNPSPEAEMRKLFTERGLR